MPEQYDINGVWQFAANGHGQRGKGTSQNLLCISMGVHIYFLTDG